MRNVYLESYLAPLEPYLARDDVTDLYINRPGELWIEPYGKSPEKHLVPALTNETLQHLVRQIAALNAQGVSREHPLLAASLPSGDRIQVVLPPATRGDIAIAIRKHAVAKHSIGDFVSERRPQPAVSDPAGARHNRTATPLHFLDGDPTAALRHAVLNRSTILVSGGTSTGKTTLLNALLSEVPRHERLLLIEDAPEIHVEHENAVGLIASRGALREADITTDDLLVASLRMRPSRIVLGEIRGNEATTFLRAINTGHPGSMCTIHANSPQGAITQLAFLAMQSGIRIDWDSLISYIESSIDLLVYLERADGRVSISSIAVPSRNPMLAA